MKGHTRNLDYGSYGSLQDVGVLGPNLGVAAEKRAKRLQRGYVR